VEQESEHCRLNSFNNESHHSALSFNKKEYAKVKNDNTSQVDEQLASIGLTERKVSFF
jgi:hypothetical protein